MSRARILKRPRAQADLVEHFAFIAADKLAPAERFLKVAEEGFERLAQMPGLGRAWESDLARSPAFGCIRYLIIAITSSSTGGSKAELKC
jgi:plasmid stabilization system protein ParE